MIATVEAYAKSMLQNPQMSGDLQRPVTCNRSYSYTFLFYWINTFSLLLKPLHEAICNNPFVGSISRVRYCSAVGKKFCRSNVRVTPPVHPPRPSARSSVSCHHFKHPLHTAEKYREMEINKHVMIPAHSTTLHEEEQLLKRS